MVSSYQGNAIRVAHFEAQEQEERLNRIEAPVNEVAHEKVVGIGDVTANPEEFHQVVELAMNIAAYRDWSIHADHVSFLDQKLSCLVAELANLGFRDRSAGSQLCDGSKSRLSVINIARK